MEEELQRVTLDLPKWMATEVKVKAALRSISMKLWIMRAIQKELDEQRKYEEKVPEIHSSGSDR